MGLKQVLRRLLKIPVFTSISLVTLAVGIGANTAIFSVVEGILLKPLAYPHPDELVAIDHTAPGLNIQHAGSAPFLHFTYQDDARTFQRMGLWSRDSVSVTGIAQPEQVVAIDVTDGVLPVISVQPVLGRVFSPSDDLPSSEETVVLSGGYWRSRFGGQPSVIGTRLLVDGKARAVIGVMPETFSFLDQKPALFLPLRLDRNHTFLGNFSFQSVARLKPGVTMARAESDLARLIPAALHRFPVFPGTTIKMFEDVGLGVRVRLLKDDLVGDVGNTLWILMGTIGLVLLIACANVANLLLVRAESRQQELAIRAALGAGAGRIAGELLAESVALGVMGGVLGLGLAFGALKLLTTLAPANLPRLDEISIDGPVLFFTFLVSVVAGLLFGLIPVVKYAGPGIASALRSSGRSATEGRDRQRTQNSLVVIQVALALVLLVSSGLMIRTFQKLSHVPPGFERPSELQTFRISIPESQVSDPLIVVRMEQAIADKLAQVPGVASVALTSNVPMSDSGRNDPIYAEDRPDDTSKIGKLRRYRFIAPGLMRTMGTPIVAGRDLTWPEVYEARPVALVSENVARELWRDPQAAIGHRIRDISSGPWREVVGVVADSRDDGVNKPAPSVVYWPILMHDFSGDKTMIRRVINYMIRSPRAGQAGFLSELSQAVWSVNPNLPLAIPRTMRDVYEKSLARTSFTLVMLAIAGGMALILGGAGLYGVISYAVSQRTREIGIRMALGARHGEVTALFVGRGVRLTAAGMVCGLVGAFVVTRLLTSLLFEVSAVDPLTYLLVSLALAGAAVMASYLPALRATRISPVEALRSE